MTKPVTKVSFCNDSLTMNLICRCIFLCAFHVSVHFVSSQAQAAQIDGIQQIVHCFEMSNRIQIRHMKLKIILEHGHWTWPWHDSTITFVLMLLKPIQTKRRIDHRIIWQWITNAKPYTVYLTSSHSNDNIKWKWIFGSKKKRIVKKVNVQCMYIVHWRKSKTESGSFRDNELFSSFYYNSKWEVYSIPSNQQAMTM